MKTFTTTRLVSQVTMKGALATGDFSDQEILDQATDCLLSELAPFLISLREEYFVRNVSMPITAGQAAYPIPSRAAGMTLRDVKIIKGTEICPIYQRAREDITSTAQGTPSSFYKENNDIILYPTPMNTEHTLKLSYLIRLSSLVPEDECGRITTIDTATKTITGSFPSTWTTANTMDLINGLSGYDHRGTDLTVTSVSTSSITFTDTLPTTLQVGDYVSLAEESCFPQVPQEAHQLLVQMTVASCLAAKGDREGLGVVMGTIAKMQENMKNLMKDRVQGMPQRFKSQLI